MVYLDANASEVPRPNAVEVARQTALRAGNPSSVHRAGHQARRLLEMAREEIAAFFQQDPENCIFTSGATEANHLLLQSFCRENNPYYPVFVGATEHPSLLEAAPKSARIIPVFENGLHDLNWLRQALLEFRAKGSAEKPLICVMVANNETGIYSDLEALHKLTQEFGAWLHLDGVQAFGRGWKIPDYLRGAASFVLSGHKMGGLLGAGALIVPDRKMISPMLKGGGQEHGMRGGTPALPAIMAMSASLREAQSQVWEEIAKMRDALEAGVTACGARIIGKNMPRLPNTSSIILENMSSQAQLMVMDMAGICVSAGSACASGKMGDSSVLRAMGLKKDAGEVMRVSLPWNCQRKDINVFLKEYGAMAERVQKK